jgi:acyl carrier protein
MATNPENLSRVLKTIAGNVAQIMPDVDAGRVSLDGRLADYGCNSIDRADIVWKTLEDLELDIPVVEFAAVTDIRSLAELLCSHLGGR